MPENKETDPMFRLVRFDRRFFGGSYADRRTEGCPNCGIDKNI